LAICPTCKTPLEGEAQFCPRDGSPLVPSRDGDRITARGLGSDAATSSSEPGGRAQRPDPLLGRVLGGRYRLTARLGQGGMGTVYRAVHTLMEKPVAVKVLRAELATDAEAVARFHREARSASKLDHDHCIRVTDFGQSDEGLLYLVMELLDGSSLGTVIRRGPVPEARAAAIALAVAEALEHAHEAGIIHRDLKPDNVFLARRNKGRELVKVLDFGLAKLASDSALGRSITQDGTVFGTPEYMAPEQAEGEKLDGRTDVYALGVLTYQLLTGVVPFSGGNFVALLTRQVQEKPVPPRSRRPDLPISSGMEQLVMCCLEKRPDARYGSAQALCDALRPFAARDASLSFLLPAAEPEPGPAAPESGVETRRGQTYEPTDSQLMGELKGAQLGRRFAMGLLVLALIGSAVVGTWMRLAGKKPTPAAGLPAPQPPALERARALFAAGDLGAAERLLDSLAGAHESAEAQELWSQIGERRGNRLAALAHQHRAARLTPRDPMVRAHLGELLYRLGQPLEACKQARAVLDSNPSGRGADSARTLLVEARCKEVP
jgi:serine/threonine-protein kinase